MTPRAIEVHIEELVLHGLPQSTRWQIGAAIESELSARLTRDGLPVAWQSSPQQLDAGSVKSNTYAKLGTEIARAIHGGSR
jgi:hypothetical protein